MEKRERPPATLNLLFSLHRLFPCWTKAHYMECSLGATGGAIVGLNVGGTALFSAIDPLSGGSLSLCGRARLASCPLYGLPGVLVAFATKACIRTLRRHLTAL